MAPRDDLTMRGRSTSGRRIGPAAASVAAHLLIVGLILTAPKPAPPVALPKPPVIEVELFTPPPPPPPLVPAVVPAPAPEAAGAGAPAAAPDPQPAPAARRPLPTPPRPAPRQAARLTTPPPPDVEPLPVPPAPKPAPMPTLGDAELAGALTAGSGSGAGTGGGGGAGAGSGSGMGAGDGSGAGGGACNMVQRLQDALRDDVGIRSAILEAHREEATGGRALLVWNGDWIRNPRQEGKGLAGVRQAIAVEVAFAPRACRNEPVRGLVLLTLADGPGAPRVVLGRAQWRWSDLTSAR